jgi:deoxyribodipyrimidine photo-lyase
MSQTVMHWFRRDLRLRDNIALHHALQSGAQVIPVFIFDPIIGKSDRIGAPRMAFLLNALQALDRALQGYGSRLLVRFGKPMDVLSQLLEETQAQALYFNRDYSPYATQRDQHITETLPVRVFEYDDALLLPPGSVLKDDGKPYTVFTPFKKKWNTISKPSISDIMPQRGDFYDVSLLPNDGIPTLTALGYPNTIELPNATEDQAHDLLEAFLYKDIKTYAETRNFLPINPFAPERPVGTSYLSPYLRLGLLSPRACYWSARQAYSDTRNESTQESIQTWVSELTWREFYTHILYFFPHVLQRDFVNTYHDLAWRNDPEELRMWQDGMTGYPIVDAPMRQLLKIGWIPNRARMVVASFLTKHLLIHWIHGDKHFMQHLIDGDPAANNGGWQWSAGTGTDAQPYFRIFNPISQSEKFATPDYLRYWLPELASIPDKFIHTPWLAPNPPKQYPLPIVDHDFARKRTLDAFKLARGEKIS